MDRDKKAHDAQLRATGIYEKRPERARAVHRGIAEIEGGLTCRYEQDGHAVVIDMAEAIGGDDHGPSPGYFGRAAISGCLAIGIKMAATRERIRLDTVRVKIEQDWDNRGILAMPGASPVPLETRIAIGIASPERQEVVDELVSRAVAQDPWYLAFRDAQTITTAVTIAAEHN